jgi:cytochrome c553
MTDAIDNIVKKRGRGRPATNATPLMVRLSPDQLAALDAWIAAQAEQPSRPEAVRQLLARYLPNA